MRDILFRGKRTDSSEWVYGDLNRYISGSGLFIADGFSMVRVDAKTVGQHTGLTDKNGKRIFEGDIISFKMYSALGYLRCRIGVVKYCDRSAGFYVLATTGDAWSWCECEDIEVIGNIHDNPELMRDGEQNATG